MLTAGKSQRGKKKVVSTWNLTEEGVVFAESHGDGRVHGGLTVAGRQLRPRVIPTLIVVILDV